MIELHRQISVKKIAYADKYGRKKSLFKKVSYQRKPSDLETVIQLVNRDQSLMAEKDCGTIRNKSKPKLNRFWDIISLRSYQLYDLKKHSLVEQNQHKYLPKKDTGRKIQS